MQQNNKNALVILNHAAGLGTAEEYSSAIIGKLSAHGFISSEIIINNSNDLIPAKTISECSDIDLILCCGGDGSLFNITNEYINNGSRATIGLIPFGYNNSFAKACGIAEDFDSAMNTVLSGSPFKYDVGRINDKFFNLVASFVAAPAMNYITSQQMKDAIDYSKHILRTIGELNLTKIGSSFHMTIESQSERIEGDFLYGAVFNHFSSDSKINDGIMELFLLKSPETHEEALEVLDVLRQGSLDHPDIIKSQITCGSFTAETEIALSLDGEFNGFQKNMQLNVLKEKMAIITPISD